jgi:predicted AAA+ superfamily ATPase
MNMMRSKLKSLDSWINKKKRKPLVIRGARQVGKSTLVSQFAEKNGLTIHEINLEKHRDLDPLFASLDITKILSEIQYICKKGSPKSDKSLIFLDEIQAVPGALAALRYFYEELPDVPVIATGSLIEFALSKHSFSMPVGRIEYMFMNPMTFSEFLQAKGEDSLIHLLDTFRMSDTFPASAHRQLLELLRQFLMTGGMPQAVDSFIETNDFKEVMSIQSSILGTYQDDFSKYCTGSQLALVQKVFDRIPLLIGKKMKYTNIDSGHLSRDLGAAVQMLAKAGVISNVTHSDAVGIPLKAGEDSRIYKPYFLDCGLMNRSCRVEWVALDELMDTRFVNEGNLAEQFICQHLLALENENESPRLHYWLREKKSSNSEVDFLLQINRDIIPVEVKSGKSGTLRSLHQFAYHRNNKRALRFDTNPPSSQVVSHKVKSTKVGFDNVSYELISLPLYMVEQYRRLLC